VGTITGKVFAWGETGIFVPSDSDRNGVGKTVIPRIVPAYRMMELIPRLSYNRVLYEEFSRKDVLSWEDARPLIRGIVLMAGPQARHQFDLIQGCVWNLDATRHIPVEEGGGR